MVVDDDHAELVRLDVASSAPVEPPPEGELFDATGNARPTACGMDGSSAAGARLTPVR